MNGTKILMAAVWLVVLMDHALAQVVEEAESTAVATTERNAELDRGWHYPYSLKLGGNLIDHSSVVGQPEGQTTTWSVKGDIAANYASGLYEFESGAALVESQTRSNEIDRYVKSADELKLDSLGRRFFQGMTWLGAYMQLRAAAPLFAGYDERADDTDYLITRVNGDVEEERGDRLKLTDGLRPLTAKQATGAVFRLSNKPVARTELRTGVGAKQNFSAEQFAVDDDDETEDVVEVVELQDTKVIGWEVVGQVSGEVKESSMRYKIFAEALYPLTYSPEGDDDPDRMKLINTEVGAELAFAIAKYLSLSYSFVSKRDPLLQPQAQVSHNLLLAADIQSD